MFGIDINELLLIAVVALVVLGPDKLPGAARTAGAIVRRARNAWASVRDEVAQELDSDTLAQHWREGSAAVRAAAAAAQANLGAARAAVDAGIGAVRAGETAAPAAPIAGDEESAAPVVPDSSTAMTLLLARSAGELRTLAARLDDAAGAERDELRAVAADVRGAAERLAAILDQPVPAATDDAAQAAGGDPARAVASSLDAIAARLRDLTGSAAATASDATAAADARGAPHE